MSLQVRTDITLKGLDALVMAAGPKANRAIARGLNRAGTPAANAGKRTIREVLGLRKHPYAKGTVTQAVQRYTSVRKASAATLTFSMAGFGRGLPLIWYQPKETPAGATVHWLGARKLFPRSFYLSGRFPRRKRGRISHAVWERTGKGKWALSRPRGPGVPEAMQSRPFTRAWERDATARLPHHMKEALLAALRGY